jgi:hypothetical protein
MALTGGGGMRALAGCQTRGELGFQEEVREA